MVRIHRIFFFYPVDEPFGNHDAATLTVIKRAWPVQVQSPVDKLSVGGSPFWDIPAEVIKNRVVRIYTGPGADGLYDGGSG